MYFVFWAVQRPHTHRTIQKRLPKYSLPPYLFPTIASLWCREETKQISKCSTSLAQPLFTKLQLYHNWHLAAGPKRVTFPAFSSSNVTIVRTPMTNDAHWRFPRWPNFFRKQFGFLSKSIYPKFYSKIYRLPRIRRKNLRDNQRPSAWAEYEGVQRTCICG